MKRMNARKTGKNGSIIGQFSWPMYLLTVALLGVLTLLPVMAAGGGATILKTGHQYIIWYVLYWCLIALIFSLITAWQKYQSFDRPMHILSDAAGKVADGDFSVRIEPLHAPAHQNEVDAMFRDFNKMTAELGSLNMMKKDFISNVSHEFKTPLSVIVNYAQYLQDETLDDATRQEYLNTIISSAGQLNALVTDILRLNKVENQAISLNRRSYDLCRQLCDCAISFEDKWDEKDIDFGVEVEEHCEVFADAELLSVVWNNLISNALKFTEPGGTVTLRQHSDETSITVQVTDSGCGMDEGTLRHIFDKFYQGDTSHSKEGNGLGLSLVKRIVELSDGTIRVESAVGHGTTFTVVLPRQGNGTSNGEVV